MKKRAFYGVVLLQVLFLVGMILYNYSTIWWGREILLEIVPVDPHSLFSGEYVDLQYKLSAIDLQELEYPMVADKEHLMQDFKRGRQVFVGLEQKGRYWEATRVSLKRSDMGDGLYMAGRVRHLEDCGWDRAGSQASRPILYVQYGIESFYTPEGEAIKYEKLGANKVKVRVAVDQFGRSKVLGLTTEK